MLVEGGTQKSSPVLMSVAVFAGNNRTSGLLHLESDFVVIKEC